MVTGGGGSGSSLWTEWTRQLDESGVVELTAGSRVVARVDRDGVLLPARDLRVRWTHLGFADGAQTARLDMVPSTLTLWVSRAWWTRHIAESTGDERRRAEGELRDGWARPSVSFKTWSRVPVESFGEWLSAEAIARAPMPDRYLLTPTSDSPVFDRDSNRPVPLDRLPVSHVLQARLAAWGAAADAVPAAERSTDAAWEAFLPEGRALAASLQEETGRPAAVWADCPEVP